MKLEACVLISITAMALGCNAPRVPRQLANSGDVHSITLETTLPGAEKKVEIDDPSSVEALTSLAGFRRKPACACAHFESVVFHTQQGPISASICDYCFDLLEGASYANYEMTPAFHDKYVALLGTWRPEGDR